MNARRSVLALIAASLAGCAGTDFEWSQARRIQIGMTQAEVSSFMGRPHTVVARADGTVWVWSYANLMTGTRAVSVVFREGVVVQVPDIPSDFR